MPIRPARSRACFKDRAPTRATRAGAPIRAITSTTPTAVMALTTVKAVARVIHRRRLRTGKPALAAPTGSTPRKTSWW